ncbi:MAG: hypothetical protein VYA84_03445, partial [Planctomycetota bacterium]|nr:hypothetical protein [Planctomycetota bacterium]
EKTPLVLYPANHLPCVRNGVADVSREQIKPLPWLFSDCSSCLPIVGQFGNSVGINCTAPSGAFAIVYPARM